MAGKGTGKTRKPPATGSTPNTANEKKEAKPKKEPKTEAEKQAAAKKKAAQSAANTRAQLYLDKFDTSPKCKDNKDKIANKCKTKEDKPEDPKKPTKKKSNIVTVIGTAAHAVDDAAKAAYKLGGYKPNESNAWVEGHCAGLWAKPSSKGIEKYGKQIQESLEKLKSAKLEMLGKAADKLYDLAKEKLTPGYVLQKAGGMAVRSVAKEVVAVVLAPTGIGTAGSVALTAWTVKDVIETATELATAIGPEGLAVLEEINALKNIDKKVDEVLKKYKENPMAAAADGQELMARFNPCVAARRCQLVPYNNTDSLKAAKTGSGCCPGQTGHHLLPNEMFQECGAYTEQIHKAAPTVCVEGVNNSHGSHGKIHTAMDELMKFHGRQKGDAISTQDAISEAAKSHKRTFPGCNSDCLEQQLHAYYDGLCDGKMKPRGGLGGADKDAGDGTNPNAEERGSVD